MSSPTLAQPFPPEVPEPLPSASAGAVVAACAGLFAAWAAAGSLGLMAPALEHALAWLGLAVALVAVWPFQLAEPNPDTLLRLNFKQWAVIGATVVALAGHALLPQLGGLVAVVLVLATLAATQTRLPGRLLRITAFAVAGFALYRFAYDAVPWVWILADGLAQALSRLTAAITGRPLRVGATFAGVDFLILMFGVYAGWLVATPRPRIRRAVIVAAAILAGHLVFLTLLTFAPEIAAALPTAPPPPETEREQAPIWFWGDTLRSLVPWLLPLAAGLINTLLTALIFRWTVWQPEVPQQPDECPAGKRRLACRFAPVALALLVPLFALLAPFRADLAGRTIVAYDRGLLDWGRPEHGRYGDESAGMLGMLPELVASLHGRLVHSADLAPRDLARADLLLLVHPTTPWPAEQLERLWGYVRGGGSLLLVAENRASEQGVTSAFNEILAPTAIRVRYDSAFKATRNWEGMLQASGVAAAARPNSGQNPYRTDSGSSLEIGPAASPLLVGRFGWSDPGSDAVGTRAGGYDSGERLGDLVLAAQQRFGRGRVVVLGDTTPLSNLGIPSSYPFVGRLLAWMASRGPDPQAWPRQVLALVCLAGLLFVLLRRPTAERLAGAVIAFGVSLVACGAVNSWSSEVLPDGRPADDSPAPVRLAYIGASHLEAHAGGAWTDEGLNGLSLNLMRNGYLPLILPRLDAAHLDRAGMLISIGPARPFSSDERLLIQQFVRRGGIWICTAGAEDAEPVRPLLADFGLGLARSPVGPDESAKEPEPLGCIFSPYYQNDEGVAQMLLYAAWPIESSEPDVTIRARRSEGCPVVATRPVGRGMVALIGDTRFALNKNLEQADGQPIYGGYHNANFWRWFIPLLNGRSPWIPPVAKPSDDTEEPAKPQPPPKPQPPRRSKPPQSGRKSEVPR